MITISVGQGFMELNEVNMLGETERIAKRYPKCKIPYEMRLPMYETLVRCCAVLESEGIEQHHLIMEVYKIMDLIYKNEMEEQQPYNYTFMGRSNRYFWSQYITAVEDVTMEFLDK